MQEEQNLPERRYRYDAEQAVHGVPPLLPAFAAKHQTGPQLSIGLKPLTTSKTSHGRAAGGLDRSVGMPNSGTIFYEGPGNHACAAGSGLARDGRRIRKGG